MNNNKFEILLHDYFDNLLSPEQVKEFEEYLLDNIDMAIELGKLKTLRRRLNNLPSTFSPDPIVIEHIYNSLLEGKKEEQLTEVSDEVEEKVVEKSKGKKKKEKKEKRLKAKTKYRLKILFVVLFFILVIGVITRGYLYYSKKNKTTPWQVEMINVSDGNSIEKTVEVNSAVLTSENERALISIANIGKIELKGKSKILILEGTRSENKIIFSYGYLAFTPMPQNKAFLVKVKNLLLKSEQSKFKIVSTDKSYNINIETSFITILNNEHKFKIPLEHEFTLLNNNTISIPLNKKTSIRFSKLVKNYMLSGNEKTLESLIAAAGKTDVFSLHYLLYNVPPVYREKILVKLHKLFPALTESNKEKILFLDERELNFLWDELFSLSQFTR